jgi:hypothetical protein
MRAVARCGRATTHQGGDRFKFVFYHTNTGNTVYENEIYTIIHHWHPERLEMPQFSSGRSGDIKISCCATLWPEFLPHGITPSTARFQLGKGAQKLFRIFGATRICQKSHHNATPQARNIITDKSD